MAAFIIKNPKLKTQHFTSRSGFTLLEVLVVLLLISVASALAGVSMTGFLPSARLAAASRELAATIHHARNLAVLRGQEQMVLFNLDRQAYGLKGQPEKGLPAGVTLALLDASSTEIRSGLYAVTVSPVGSIENMAAFRLHTGRKTLRIDTDPVVGTVTVREGKR